MLQRLRYRYFTAEVSRRNNQQRVQLSRNRPTICTSNISYAVSTIGRPSDHAAILCPGTTWADPEFLARVNLRIRCSILIRQMTPRLPTSVMSALAKFLVHKEVWRKHADARTRKHSAKKIIRHRISIDGSGHTGARQNTKNSCN